MIEFVYPDAGGFEREPDPDYSMFLVDARVRWLASHNNPEHPRLKYRAARGVIVVADDWRKATRHGPHLVVRDLDTNETHTLLPGFCGMKVLSAVEALADIAIDDER